MFVTDSEADKRETSPAGRTPGRAPPCVVSIGARGVVVGLLGARLLFRMPTSPPPAPALLCVGLCVCTRDCHVWPSPPDGRNVKMPAQPCGTAASWGTCASQPASRSHSWPQSFKQEGSACSASGGARLPASPGAV